MNTLSYKTVSANKATAKKEWIVIDAENEIVGRLCSAIAKIILFIKDRKEIVLSFEGFIVLPFLIRVIRE